MYSWALLSAVHGHDLISSQLYLAMFVLACNQATKAYWLLQKHSINSVALGQGVPEPQMRVDDLVTRTPTLYEGCFGASLTHGLPIPTQ